jgi:multidrug efflux system membrane fusion protein
MGTTRLPAISEPATTTPRREPPPPRGRRRSYTWVWLLLLAGLGYAGWRYYQAGQQKQQVAAQAQAVKASQRPISVISAPVRIGDIPLYLRGLGSVTAYNTVAVKSRVDGQLIAIHFTEGQFVNKGDLLAEIDPRPFQVQLEQAQGQMARDQAQLNDAKVNLARYDALWKEQVIAKQQLDTQAAQVKQFEGVLESDQAAIDSAKLQLTYSKVTSPLSGRIGLRQVDVGNVVHAADANGMVVIAQMQPITVLFTIPADNLPAVLKKLRGGVKLRVDAYDRDDKNKIATGTLLTVDNQIDQSTGTSRLKAVFDNSDGALFPNQFVNCRLLLDIKHNAVLVSAPAIQRGPQGTFVYLVAPNKTAVVRQVKLGTTEGDDVSIDQGLKGGEIVIIEGQDKLQDGSKVDTRSGDAQPSSSPRRRRGP